MTERWFLELDGIPGGSTHDHHGGEIDVQAWSWGVSARPRSTAGAGAGAGRPEFAPLEIVAAIGVHSPRLFQACGAGRHIATAVLAGVHQGGAEDFDFVSIRLSDIVVTSYRLGDTGDAPPAERCTLDYGRVELRYVPQLPTGGAGPPALASFDVARGR